MAKFGKRDATGAGGRARGLAGAPVKGRPVAGGFAAAMGGYVPATKAQEKPPGGPVAPRGPSQRGGRGGNAGRRAK